MLAVLVILSAVDWLALSFTLVAELLATRSMTVVTLVSVVEKAASAE
jgi:hypothetical protein